jgi:uncharacterized protein HemX
MSASAFQPIAQFLSTAHGAATLSVTLTTAALGLAVAAYKFWHEQFRKVPLEHLKLLKEAASGDELLGRCLKQAAHLEVARQTFGPLTR